jgi:hypothetical protein
MTDYEDVNGNEPTIVAPGAVANPNIDRGVRTLTSGIPSPLA